jgi:hypothetical protein
MPRILFQLHAAPHPLLTDVIHTSFTRQQIALNTTSSVYNVGYSRVSDTLALVCANLFDNSHAARCNNWTFLTRSPPVLVTRGLNRFRRRRHHPPPFMWRLLASVNDTCNCVMSCAADGAVSLTSATTSFSEKLANRSRRSLAEMLGC